MRRLRAWVASTVLAGAAAGTATFLAVHAQQPGAATPAPSRADLPTPPGVAYTTSIPPESRRVFFGDLHLHTSMSFDAWSWGTKIGPAQAYAFARGERVMLPAIQVLEEEGVEAGAEVPVRRAWPLDFLAVTDHSEGLAGLRQLDDPASPLSQTDAGKRFRANPTYSFGALTAINREVATKDPAIMARAWQETMDAANKYYAPGRFTTFIAYEWTSNLGGGNMHRNVIFNANDAPAPFTASNSARPEDLWTYLESVRAGGRDVVAIPHNANASNGLMFDWNTSDHRPIDEAYAQRRALNEPLTEIDQNKGQSETIPALSPNDEFADFEVYDHLLSGAPGKSDGSYIRQAYGRGLVIQSKVGANPFKYGLVGASDIHNGLSVSDENGFAGGHFGIDPSRMLPAGNYARNALGMTPVGADGTKQAASDAGNLAARENTLVEVSPGALTGVWAEENTRNAVFAALKRKETFATSGTRMRVRMFAGWSLPPDVLRRPDWVKICYAQGVPMGADLPARPAGASAPIFVLQATKDPDGANLDRIQVIKVWLDAAESREKVFDVAVSNGRAINPATGHANEAVGDTVDLKTGKYSNTIGGAILSVAWRDPEFKPEQAAAYYARVLEIPTPRWSTLLAIRNHLPLSTLVPATIQERAWASPVWYTPAKP
jgi:hypothetical protein